MAIIDKVHIAEALDVAANSLPYALQALRAGCDDTVADSEHEEAQDSIRGAYDGTARCMAVRSEWDRSDNRFVSEVDAKNPRSIGDLEQLIAREVARLKADGHDIDVRPDEEGYDMEDDDSVTTTDSSSSNESFDDATLNTRTSHRFGEV